MPEFLTTTFREAAAASPAEILLRLFVSLVFGFAVAWVYRRTTNPETATASLPATLVLLCILIAMVTQVIGDNVARAFSLVGALAIVRFRTVVRDTRDTAFVIFAVVVGMAVGALNLWVAVMGLIVCGGAAFIMAGAHTPADELVPTYRLQVRGAVGLDLEAIVSNALGGISRPRQLISIGTARQGSAIDIVYEIQLESGRNASELVKELNRLEGILEVNLERRGYEEA